MKPAKSQKTFFLEDKVYYKNSVKQILRKNYCKNASYQEEEKHKKEDLFRREEPVHKEQQEEHEELVFIILPIVVTQFKQDHKYTDLTYLNRIAEGSDDFVKKMIETFIVQTPVLLQRMSDCEHEKKWDELRDVTHKLKPSIDFMGIQSLWETVKDIEKYAGKKTNLELLPDLLNKVNVVCVSAIEELKQEIKKDA